MRALIVVHGFPPTFYAGAERAAERMALWLVKNGHEADVFAIEQLDAKETRVEVAEQNGITVHRLFYNISGHAKFYNMYEHPAVGQAFQSVIQSKPFDVVHIVSGYLMGAQVIHIAKQANIPVIITLTEYWFMCTRLNLLQSNGLLCSGPESAEKCARCLLEEKRRYQLPARVAPQSMELFWTVMGPRTPHVRSMIDKIKHRQQTLRTALDEVDTIISPSQFLIGKFKEFGFDTSRSVYIRHGLTINQERPQPRIRRQKGTLRLGYIGQIKPHKGTDLIIDAVLPLIEAGEDITLEIWGPEHEAPEYAQHLRQRTADYPTVCWQGRYDAPEVWDILKRFDALLVPSRWYENSPTVIAEAFTTGVPVIATNLGGMAELIEHEKSGLLFELNDMHDLQHQIHRLLKEPDLLGKLSDGIPPVKTAEQEAQEIFEQYQKLMK